VSVELYWGSGSPYSWRALLAAEIKDVPYESRLISFQNKDHRSPAFLEMNPRGRVPVLKDGDLIISESMAIMSYLDHKGPKNPLFGHIAAETARIWEATSRVIYDLENAIRTFVDPILFSPPAGDTLARAQAAASAVHDELRRLEEALARHDYLCGDTISAADLAAFPFLMFVLRAANKDSVKTLEPHFLPLEQRYPLLAAWKARIETIPGYEKTYPPHWK
jgi:glutathione S-transferase